MDNLFLIADGTDDWYEAERCRGEIEHLWNFEDRRIDPDDYEARKTLSDLRTSLDQLKEDQEQQRPEDFYMDLLYPEAVDDEEDEDGELMLQVAEAVLGAEITIYGRTDPVARQFEVTGEESAQAKLAREVREAWEAGKGSVATGEESQQDPPAATVSPSKPAEGLPWCRSPPTSPHLRRQLKRHGLQWHPVHATLFICL